MPVPVDPAYLAPLVDLSETQDRPVVMWVHHLGMVHNAAPVTIAALRAAGCTVIEDCAYVAFGTGDEVGQWGDAAVLTFGPTKPNAGSGGGVIVSRDAHLANEIAAHREHGGQDTLWRAGGEVLRYRSLGEMEAILAYQQWCARDERREALTSVSAAYSAGLDKRYLPDGRSAQRTWGRFPIDVGERDGEVVRHELWHEHGIRTTRMYDSPWFDLPALRSSVELIDEAWDDLRSLLRRSLCLPFHPAMTNADVTHVCNILNSSPSL